MKEKSSRFSQICVLCEHLTRETGEILHVLLTIKERDTLSDGRVAINLVLRLPGHTPSLRKSGKRIFPAQWDKAARRVKPTEPNAQLLNNYLREQIQRLESIILELERENLSLTYKNVWARYMGQTEGTDIAAYAHRRMAELKPQVAAKTYEDYRGGLARITAYQPHVRFEDISVRWLEQYEGAQRQKGRRPNGIFRDFSVLRKFWNLARQEGIVKHYPFSDYKLPKEETIREFLMPDELDRFEQFFLEQADQLSGLPPSEGQYKTLGFYLFSCFTGLSHDDLIKRRDWQWLPDHLIIRRGKTKRTGKLTTIPLISRAKNLVPHVQTHTIKLKKPRITEDLRGICRKLGINKHLTYHTARHTFAINSLMRGVNIKVIQKILGHSSVRTTEVYLRIVDEYVDQEMAKWE